MDHKIPDILEKLPFYCDIYANFGESTKGKITNLINTCDNLMEIEKELIYSDKNQWIDENNYKIMKFDKGILLDLDKIMDYIMELHRLNKILTKDKDFYKYENQLEENLGYTFRITDKNTKKTCHSISSTASLYTILIKIVKCIDLSTSKTAMDQLIINNKDNLSVLCIEIMAYVKYTDKKHMYSLSETLKKDDYCPNTAADNTTGPRGPGDISIKNTVNLPDVDVKYKILLDKYNELKIKHKLLPKPDFVKTLIYSVTNTETDNNKTFYGSLIVTKDIDDVDKHIMKLFTENSKYNEGIKSDPKKYKKTMKKFYKLEHIKELKSDNKFETNINVDYYIEKYNSILKGYNNKYNSAESAFVYKNAKYDKDNTLTKAHDNRLTYSMQLVLNKMDFMDYHSNKTDMKKSNVIISIKNIKTSSGNVYYCKNQICEHIEALYNNSKTSFLSTRVNNQSQFSKDLSTHKFADYEVKILENIIQCTEAEIQKKICEYKTLLTKQKYIQTVTTFEKKFSSTKFHKKKYWANK